MAHRLRRLVVLPRGREHGRRAKFARDLRRAGIGDDEEGLGVDDRLERGQQHVRPDVAGDEIDLVGLDQLLGLLLADFRLEAVVFVDHLDRQTAHLAAHVIERELEGIAHILPMTATGPLNVLTKPILIDFCWATAGPAASSRAALAAKSALRI